MASRFVDTLRSARATAILAALDAGAGAGRLKGYSGTVPATKTDVALGTLLFDVPLSDPAGSVTAGVLTMTVPAEDASADASGTAGCFQATDSDGNVVFDGNITATGGGGTLELVTVTIVAGQPVQISSFVITEGNA